MALEHVGHADIAKFAQDKVNLPKEKSDEYKRQAKRLRDKLEAYLKEHPSFALKKMLLSGSIAKGTALKSINDIDVACYISGSDAPTDVGELLEYLAERLRSAFPNFSPDQIQPQTYCVTVSFRGTGLDVDVVPILNGSEPDWYGDLVSQEDGSFLKTSIPKHLEFCRKRKAQQDKHFAQVVRLAKFWARRMKNTHHGFRFKSFMIEMIMSKLIDEGLDFADYPEALQGFFTYILKTELRDRIWFDDYYAQSAIGSFTDPVQIIDPVNPENNVSKLYTDQQVDMIVDAASDASDAIDWALTATTKSDTINCWQKVFGPSFNV